MYAIRSYYAPKFHGPPWRLVGHRSGGNLYLCPQSPQEAFDFTVDAFNLAETYRVPVMFLMDECVGHMTEKVVIPPPEERNNFV